MTKRIKMVPYNSKATCCLGREKQLEQVKMRLRRKVYKAKKQVTNPTQKVKLLKKEELKKEVVYIQHVVCDVENDVNDKTKCYVYFDA